MTDKRILMIAVAAAMVIVLGGVVYYYRKGIKKALEQPKETAEFLAAELKEFLHSEQTRKTIGALCRLADQLVGGTGRERLAYVSGKLYELVPDHLQSVITIEKLQEIVNTVYAEIKVYIDGHWVAGQ